MSDSEADLIDGPLLDVSGTETVATTHRCNNFVYDRQYQSKASLKRHLKVHEKDVIRCSLCSQYFKSEEEKKAHVEMKHPRVVCETR